MKQRADISQGSRIPKPNPSVTNITTTSSQLLLATRLGTRAKVINIHQQLCELPYEQTDRQTDRQTLGKT